jgi:hypothetical protein
MSNPHDLSGQDMVMVSEFQQIFRFVSKNSCPKDMTLNLSPIEGLGLSGLLSNSSINKGIQTGMVATRGSFLRTAVVKCAVEAKCTLRRQKDSEDRDGIIFWRIAVVFPGAQPSSTTCMSGSRPRDKACVSRTFSLGLISRRRFSSGFSIR